MDAIGNESLIRMTMSRGLRQEMTIGSENGQIFVDEDRLSHLGLTLRDLAHFLESQPFILAVFTSDDVRRAADSTKRVTPKPNHKKHKSG